MDTLDAVVTLLPFILLSVVIVLANLEEFGSSFRWITYISLALLNLMMIMAGLIGVMLPTVDLQGTPSGASAAYGTLLRAVGFTGLLGFLPLFRPIRALLARAIPIDPDSAVHTTALVFAIYLLGQGLGQQPLLTDPEVLGGLDLQVTSGAVWAQAIGLTLLAATGIGLFIRRDWRQSLDRFGFTPLSWRLMGVSVAAVVGLIVLQIAVTLVWEAIDPESLKALEDANNLLLGQFTGLWAAITIGLSAAVGEELLFRGALQPRFGFLLTAALFTVAHSQYGLSPATLLILLIAGVLGVLRIRAGLTACVLVHFGYNFISVLLPAIVNGGY